MSQHERDRAEAPESPERRELLAKAGRYAGATSAAALVLLSTTKSADAGGIFRSGGGSTHYRYKRKYFNKRSHRKLRKAAYQRGKNGWRGRGRWGGKID